MLPQLRAERQLLAIEAASVPYMKADQHSDVIRRLNDQLGTNTKPAPATDAVLQGMGITVEHVPKEVTASE